MYNAPFQYIEEHLNEFDSIESAIAYIWNSYSLPTRDEDISKTSIVPVLTDMFEFYQTPWSPLSDTLKHAGALAYNLEHENSLLVDYSKPAWYDLYKSIMLNPVLSSSSNEFIKAMLYMQTQLIEYYKYEPYTAAITTITIALLYSRD